MTGLAMGLYEFRAPDGVRTLSTAEVARRAGVSYRQLHRWLTYQVFGPWQEPGSGNYVALDARIVPKVRLCGRLQTWCGAGSGKNSGAGFTIQALTDIVAHYDDGQRHVAPGVALIWTVEDQ